MWLYSWFGTNFLLIGNLRKPPFARSSEPWRAITVFHTLAKILPRHEIDRFDRKYGQGDKRRKSSRYVQFIVMLMAQILGLKSLREIEQAQKSKQKRLYHLGVKSPVSRSALSRMNDERSADFLRMSFRRCCSHARLLRQAHNSNSPG